MIKPEKRAEARQLWTTTTIPASEIAQKVQISETAVRTSVVGLSRPGKAVRRKEIYDEPISPFHLRLGDALRRVRLFNPHKLTQSVAAQLVKLTLPKYKAAEEGRVDLKMSEIAAIVDALKGNLEFVVHDSEE